MNISKEIEKIFAGEQKTTAEEQDVLEDALCFMRDDVETDMGDEIIYLWKAKISGAIEFLVACGKIDEKQELELHALLNRIESGEAK